MSKIKINQRGTHTSVIGGAKEVLRVLHKLNAMISPGVIQARVGGRGKSVKLKKINDETFEMIIVVNSSKQTFKVYGADQFAINAEIEKLREVNWNVQQTIDISESRQG